MVSCAYFSEVASHLPTDAGMQTRSHVRRTRAVGFTAIVATAIVAVLIGCGTEDTPPSGGDTSKDAQPTSDGGGGRSDANANDGAVDAPNGDITDAGSDVDAASQIPDGARPDSGSPAGFLQGSCNTIAAENANRGLCQDWGATVPVTSWPDSCAVQSGTFSTSPCPTTSRIGTCDRGAVGALSSWVFRFYSPTWTVTKAEDWCELFGGSFTPN
jgi:hypothetical protein